jgi:hypothetical protein
MGESQPDADSKNDQKNGTIIFTGETGIGIGDDPGIIRCQLHTGAAEFCA